MNSKDLEMVITNEAMLYRTLSNKCQDIKNLLADHQKFETLVSSNNATIEELRCQIKVLEEKLLKYSDRIIELEKDLEERKKLEELVELSEKKQPFI